MAARRRCCCRKILGTLLLGESALHYVMDARQRLVAPNAAVVPHLGCQFATLVESHDVASITSVKSWEGIDLGWFNTLQDTTSMVFTKQYGFRFSSCDYTSLSPRQQVLPVDFSTDRVGVWLGERKLRFQAMRSGTVHAVLASWEVAASRDDASSGGLVMATHPDATRDNFQKWKRHIDSVLSKHPDKLLPVVQDRKLATAVQLKVANSARTAGLDASDVEKDTLDESDTTAYYIIIETIGCATTL